MAKLQAKWLIVSCTPLALHFCLQRCRSRQHSDLLVEFAKEAFCLQFFFSIYTDDIIEKMRQSGYGIYIGTHFVGCVLYAGDIALVYCSCHGLQKLIDICQHYGAVWDIKFNATKSQAITFGGNHPRCTLKLGTDFNSGLIVPSTLVVISTDIHLQSTVHC